MARRFLSSPHPAFGTPLPPERERERGMREVPLNPRLTPWATCLRPLRGLTRLPYFWKLSSLLGLLIAIAARGPAAQPNPTQDSGCGNDGIQLILEKLDKANQSDDLEQAESLCQEIIRERPALALGYVRLGLVYKRRHDLQRALNTFQIAARVEPGSFDAQYALGETYLEAGEPDSAAISLAEAVRLRPTSGQIHRLLAQAFTAAGNTSSGLEQFLQGVEFAPRDAEAYFDLGQACLRHALGIADKLLAESKTSPYSRRIFAENYIGHGSLGEAENQYQLAIQSEPEALDLHLSLGELLLQENKPEQAQQEMMEAVRLAPTSLVANYALAEADFLARNLPSALATLERISQFNYAFLASNPTFLKTQNSESAWKEECSALAELSSSQQAGVAASFLKQACRRASASGQTLRPGGSSVTEEAGKSRVRIGIGNTTKMGNSVEPCSAGLCGACEDRLRASLPTPATAVKAHLELGRCAYDVQDYSAAFRQFAAAQELAAQSPLVRYWEQEAARQLARSSFERVEQLAPDSYMVHLLNAQTFEKENQLQLAAQEYRAAIVRRNDAANLHVLLGHLYWNWERYDDALAELLVALRLDPEDAAANYLAGDCWVQEHQADKALPYLSKAVSLRPGFLNAEASLGRALSQLGRYQEAISELLKVTTADADGSIHFQLFQLYQKVGQNDQAQEALESFKKIRAQHLPQSPSGDT